MLGGDYFQIQGKVRSNSRLIAHNVDVAQQYLELALPKIPVFHPYSPADESIERIDGGLPTFSICTKLAVGLERLPLELQNILREKGILDNNQLNVFFVTQNVPWKNTDLLFRAHYWVNPHAPYQSPNFTSDPNVFMGLLDSSNPNVRIGNSAANVLIQEVVSSHSMSDKDTVVRSSPPTPIVSGIGDPTKSCQVLSLSILENQRAALTVHWILSDIDQQYVAQTLKDMRAKNNLNLENFIPLAKGLDYKGTLNRLVSGKMSTGLMPIHFAAFTGNAEAVQELLKATQDYEILDLFELIRRRQALGCHHPGDNQILRLISDDKIFRILKTGNIIELEAIFKENRRNQYPCPILDNEQSALHLASLASTPNSGEIVECMLNFGFTPDSLYDGTGWTPVQYAIYTDNKKALECYAQREYLTVKDAEFALEKSKSDLHKFIQSHLVAKKNPSRP